MPSGQILFKWIVASKLVKSSSAVNASHEKSPKQCLRLFEYGGETQDRTGDTRIFNPLLYLLS
ncbi:MAG: hypothetical protein ACN6NX_11180, partial [Acinetobacter sp.]